MKSFPWVDYVCTQEGDVAFPELLRRLWHDGDEGPVPGILKQGQSPELTTPDFIEDLDALPIPDFSDYFEQLNSSPLSSTIDPCLVMETSRGCWWGAKHHCTFCGLNGNSMSFRSKTPERVFEELAFLTRTYGIQTVNCADEILDIKYVQTLFPKLAESDSGVKLYYEVKANLTLHQLRVMRDGGIKWIQPGIESFSNEVLRLMKKGCTGLQNIQLLRWCEELGITVDWNILSGFPGESLEEYERMAELIPLLLHLQPPYGTQPVRLDRFSPNFVKAKEYGLINVRPNRAYKHVFALSDEEIENLAYFFEFDYSDGRKPLEYTLPLVAELQRWKILRGRAGEGHIRLDAYRVGEAVLINDGRPCAVESSHRLEGIAAKVYLLCDSAQTLHGLCKKLSETAVREEIFEVLKGLMASKLMVEQEGQYLSLAVMHNRQKERPVLEQIKRALLVDGVTQQLSQ
ncbi:MAG: RiPP maturation radical SAM C-methyltransferase [Acidobacteria bacterium]|nr:RiPP maturation radical SAM C-methyltransferase [Acidobacteriota bacterium]